jgi:hypothetical protein
MLIACLILGGLGWGLWLAYMVRYPQQWAGTIDALHVRLARHGLSLEWMKRAEKGPLLKAIVGVTTVLILTCLAVTLRHPDALSSFLLATHIGH